MTAVVEIADEPLPLEDGGLYVWLVTFGSGRAVTGGAVTRELAAKAVGLALHDEQVAESMRTWEMPT